MGLILANKLSVFKSIPLDVLIGAAFLIAVAIVVILLVLARGRRIYQAFAKIVDLISDIRTSAAFEKLCHVSFLVDASGNLQTNFLRWRTVYELIYEKQFRKLVDEFSSQVAAKQKRLKISKKNLMSLLSLYKDLNNNIYHVQKTLVDDINNFLEPERFYRSYYVKMNNLYLKVLIDIDKKTAIGEFTSEDSMNEIKENINETFTDLYDKIVDGHWDVVPPIIDNLKNLIAHLINMLDTIPQLKLEVNNLIARRMRDLKNQYVTFGAKAGIDERARRWEILEQEVDKKRIDISNQIKKIQYIKGKKTLREIYNLMDDYELFASFEEGVQNKLNTYSGEITSIVENVKDRSSILIQRAKKMFDAKKANWDFYELQHLITKVNQIYDAWMMLLNNISPATRKKSVNLDKVRLDTMNLIDDFLSVSQSILKYEIEINKSTIDQSKLINQVVICDTLMNQLSVKIVQYHSVPSLKQLEPKLEALRDKLVQYTDEKLKHIKDANEINDAQRELDQIYTDAQELENKIRTNIFYDFITQELIIYMSRFPDENDDYEKFIKESIAKKNEGKYLDVIEGTTGIIAQLKARGLK